VFPILACLQRLLPPHPRSLPHLEFEFPFYGVLGRFYARVHDKK
jgi:hypothetical protein